MSILEGGITNDFPAITDNNPFVVSSGCGYQISSSKLLYLKSSEVDIQVDLGRQSKKFFLFS